MDPQYLIVDFIVLLIASKMFVKPDEFLDTLSRIGAGIHMLVNGTLDWQVQEELLDHPRHLLIAARAFGGVLVAMCTLAAYSILTGPR